MTDGSTIRAKREALGWSQAELASKAGTSQQNVDRIESGKVKLSRALPGILLALALEPATPETEPPSDDAQPADGPLHYRPPPVIMSREKSIPLYASAEGSNENGSLIISTEPMEWIPRPFTLENVKEAYAILIEGESMFPAYEPGDMAWVNPMLAARRAHDVIIYGGDDRFGEARALIKRMVSYTDAEWTLQQWNPAETFKLDRHFWRVCHRVVGKLSRR